jgi:hypothetical protein
MTFFPPPPPRPGPKRRALKLLKDGPHLVVGKGHVHTVGDVLCEPCEVGYPKPHVRPDESRCGYVHVSEVFDERAKAERGPIDPDDMLQELRCDGCGWARRRVVIRHEALLGELY